MRVWAFHDGGACSYYRVKLPLQALRDLGGWDIGMATGWDPRALGFPLVVGQRIGRVEGSPIWARVADRRRVYEVDDDLWQIDPANTRGRENHTWPILANVDAALGGSDLVTVSTPPLAEAVTRFGVPTVVLPNHIDARLLDVQRPRRDRVVVGWRGGDSHLADIRSAAPQLRRFLGRRPDVEWHSIGHDYRDVLKAPGRHTPWRDDVWDFYRAVDFDIAVVPLAHSTFNTSKSHLAALEYAALGIPVIAADAPPYRDLVVHGVTGYLVRTDHEWGTYLRELVDDPARREAMGEKAREVGAEWTIQRGWTRWADAYASLT